MKVRGGFLWHHQKNYTEVLIGGKVFTLSGFESEDYLQKVSTYLNHKLDECSNSEGISQAERRDQKYSVGAEHCG